MLNVRTLCGDNEREHWFLSMVFCISFYWQMNFIYPGMQVIVLGDGAFGRWIGHEGKALMNGISTLIKGTPGTFLAPSTMWDYSKKTAS